MKKLMPSSTIIICANGKAVLIVCFGGALATLVGVCALQKRCNAQNERGSSFAHKLENGIDFAVKVLDVPPRAFDPLRKLGHNLATAAVAALRGGCFGENDLHVSGATRAEVRMVSAVRRPV